MLSANGKDVAKSKTTLRRGMTDPEYNESFVFQMSESDLSEINVLFSVISVTKARKKKDVVGWFAMGKNASGPAAKTHWSDVMKKKETKLTRWHELCNTEKI